jgi:predicted nuclease of predicted toxin-antitoxin system
LKLLLDENLSPRLESVTDDEIWQYAKDNDFAIVSKDSDFSERSVLRGSPPKVIWLRIDNCTTIRAGFLLRDAFPRIQAFLSPTEESCLVLTLHV